MKERAKISSFQKMCFLFFEKLNFFVFRTAENKVLTGFEKQLINTGIFLV
jgi:hypothetical protein